MAAKQEEEPISAADLAKYDLFKKMVPFLDKHLCFPIIQFLEDTLQIYDTKDLQRAKLALLNGTNMIDLAKEIYELIGEEAPDELDDRRQEVLTQLEEMREKEMSLLQHLEDEEGVKRMSALKSVSEVCEQFEVTMDQVEGLVAYAKLQYECGNYSLSNELLKHYRMIMMDKDTERVYSSKNLSCIWGSIASLMLSSQHSDAAENMGGMDEALLNAKMSKKEVLLQRTWLVHWCLFAVLQSAGGTPTKALDILLHERSLSVISLSCPHLFRYVAASLILHKNLKLQMKEIVNTLNLESSNYSDPVTRFLVTLHNDLDFDGAQQELQECRKVCKSDYFLNHHWEDFQENARLQIFETYCRIHQCINIDMISDKLNMTMADAERWIVKLIQTNKLDARIDSEKSRVVMSKAPLSVYQQVIEKTKNLSFRSTMLLSNLEKHEKKGALERGV